LGFFVFKGNREVVGYGVNGLPQYYDHGDMPCPAVRWREDTPELIALKEKERGDWTKLTLDEKKTCKLRSRNL
jgi:cytochrome c oxidase subunit 4